MLLPRKQRCRTSRRRCPCAAAEGEAKGLTIAIFVSPSLSGMLSNTGSEGQSSIKITSKDGPGNVENKTPSEDKLQDLLDLYIREL